MKRINPVSDRLTYNKLKTMSEKRGGLAQALWQMASNSYGLNSFSNLWDELTKIYGEAPDQLKTAEEFWHPAVKRELAWLMGDPFVTDMKELVSMRMKGQFSSSIWRRSYRSDDFGYHASRAIREVCQCIYLSSYKQDTRELLYCEHDWLSGYEVRLALEIRRGDAEIIRLLHDAMMGENTEILLSRKMIQAIVISGHEGLLDDLIKLLVAARLQEGLRQQILESADEGSVETLIRFLKVCLDEDLFRYSSATRAFDVWTGLGYGDAKPAIVKKCAQFAYDCLLSEDIRKHYLNSENNLEVYFSLWAQGCYEIAEADTMARKLLDDERKYRRMLGWLFVSRTDSTSYRMHVAESYLEERDEEILAWVVYNLATTRMLLSSYSYNRTEWSCKPVTNSVFSENKKERRALFSRLRDVVTFVGNKNHTYTGNPFAFVSVTLVNTNAISCMMSIAGYDMDVELIDELMQLLSYMDADQRRAMYCNFLMPEMSLRHREYLRDALNDRSIHIKELAIQRLSCCKLRAEDLEALAKSLRSKSSALRKAVLSIFHKQPAEALSPIITGMLTSEEEYQNQAGIEMLLEIREEHSEIFNAQATALEALKQKKLSTQTEILLDQLKETESSIAYSEENGFGLYDAAVIQGAIAQIEERALTQKAEKPEKTGLLQRLMKRENTKTADGLWSEQEFRKYLLSQEELARIFEAMNQVFVRHANYEYEIINWEGARKKVLFGDPALSIQVPAEYGNTNLAHQDLRLEMIPFHEEFVEAMGEYATDVRKLLILNYMTVRYYGQNISYSHMQNQSWFEPMEKKVSYDSYSTIGNAKYRQRYWQMVDVIRVVYQRLDPHEVFTEALAIYRTMIQIVGEENLGRNHLEEKKEKSRIIYASTPVAYPINHRMIGFWRMILPKVAVSSEDYQIWFPLEYRLEKLAGISVFGGLRIEEFFRACEEQMIPKDVLYERLLLGPGSAEGDIRFLSNPAKWLRGRTLYQTYPWAAAAVGRVIHRIVDVEQKRGELPTVLTGVARAIERFEGAEYFCNLLAALGKESFFRGYEYSRDTTKKAVLSRLLKRCYPSEQDTPESLKVLLKKTDISDKRLAEAVMYAPQWAGFAEKILDWPGLKCGVWFFHAHINESFSAEKETEVALYSPITPTQFNDGAFDKNWFFQAYDQLGEKRFQVLYKSAKYITTGNSQHRRSQLYADAVLGKLNAEELKAEIIDKRNQEKLRCYPLIPIFEGQKDEALRRYEFIQKFLKESRQFGALRRESEKKACQTAMDNLAITTGYMDVNRLIWQMESQKMEELRPLMLPQELDGVSVSLRIDENGDAELAVTKNGKPQKTLPKSLNKNETVLALKESVKALKEQKRRAKESLERAMMECTEFSQNELRNISENPVLAPMVLTLVWNDGARNGFLQKAENGELEFCQVDGDTSALPEDAILRVAHPHDLKAAGQWAAYMHLLYEKEIRQPFKQVFREYYPITEDERQEKIISRRYAGHQVQPKRTVALLKGRGWTVDYEEGLQKVFYKENLIARMYALADWFSPADIEAPTLETVQFYDRNTGECVDLENIPPILFSETMRDLDLVVSVAHVGGVDPEASHSTVEMRIAIAGELIQLLKLSNVKLIGSHAKVYGTLGNYSIHMGSGVVHTEGVGMAAILPVHSQARGRIFLPFADDDPKTAEIMSKILLLAEDKKIKDPSILRQIRG